MELKAKVPSFGLGVAREVPNVLEQLGPEQDRECLRVFERDKIRPLTAASFLPLSGHRARLVEITKIRQIPFTPPLIQRNSRQGIYIHAFLSSRRISEGCTLSFWTIHWSLVGGVGEAVGKLDPSGILEGGPEVSGVLVCIPGGACSRHGGTVDWTWPPRTGSHPTVLSLAAGVSCKRRTLGPGSGGSLLWNPCELCGLTQTPASLGLSPQF